MFEAGTFRSGKIARLGVLLTAAVVCATYPLIGQDNSYQPTQGDPPAQVARIGDTEGDVSFMAAGATQWSAGESNYPMTSGDRLYTDQGARAEIQSGSTVVRMWASTDVTLTNLTPTYEQLGLAQGSIRVRIYGLNPGSTVEVDTPNGSAVITQPGDYRIDSYTGDTGSDVIVNAGAAQITGPGGLNQEVSGGQAVQLTGTDQVQLTSVNLPAFDALDQWSIDQDHQALNSQSAQYVSRDTPGYQDLDNNGSWSPTPDNGPVWYPSGVDAGWQPYTNGHWAYVAPWGYTWVDNAPWGYAPFHYGRWAVIGGRWGWCPGPPAVVPVYSPALVAFVGGGPGFSIGFGFGGGGGVAAWFPLGVGEPYVPWYHASPGYARQVNVTNINITNIHNTTIVNNYNTFITNTRTVNNINQLNTNNIQYAHRSAVVAVPANTMSTGAPVARAAVKLTPQQRQQFASAPVHAAPTVAAPTHSLLPVRTNVKAPVAPPTLVTPHGLAKAVPAANPARIAPVTLPKPKPATALPKPVPGVVAGRPPAPHPAFPENTPGKPITPGTRPPANQPLNPSQPVSRPAPNQPTAPKPLPPSQQRPPAPAHQTAPPRPAYPQQPAHPANPAPNRPAYQPVQPHPAPQPQHQTPPPQHQTPPPQREAAPQTYHPPPQHQAPPAARPAPAPQPQHKEPAPEKKPEHPQGR